MGFHKCTVTQHYSLEWSIHAIYLQYISLNMNEIMHVYCMITIGIYWADILLVRLRGASLMILSILLTIVD